MSATERVSKFRAWSTLGRKLITGITAMALVIFIIEHLIGNILLLSPNPEYYNAYAYDLMSWGVLLYILEIGLSLFFLLHIAAGTAVYLRKRQRGSKYVKYQSTGGNSRQTFSSKTMIWTGILLFIFIVFHLITFKYNPSLATKYVTVIDGHHAHDFYHLVYDTFANPWITLWYVIIMVLLGYHPASRILEYVPVPRCYETQSMHSRSSTRSALQSPSSLHLDFSSYLFGYILEAWHEHQRKRFIYY